MPNRRDFTFIGTTFLTSLALNYPWELAQLRFYAETGGLSAMWWHCFKSSVVDAFLVLIILSTGRLLFGEWDWFSRGSARRCLYILIAGTFVGIGVEWVGWRLLGRWKYDVSMPLIPIFGVGLVPVLQMVVLPPLIFSLKLQREHRNK